jgi:hypothetical protein
MIIEILWRFHLRSGGPSSRAPNREKPGTSGGFVPEGANSDYQLLPLPTPIMGPQALENDQRRSDSYEVFFQQALRSLGGASRSNREIAVFIVNYDLELEKIRSEQRASPDQFQTMVKWPTRKLPRTFDGELESDITTWKQELE